MIRVYAFCCLFRYVCVWDVCLIDLMRIWFRCGLGLVGACGFVFCVSCCVLIFDSFGVGIQFVDWF